MIQKIKNVLTDVHTYVVIAMGIVAAIGAVKSDLPLDWSTIVTTVLGILAIFIQQYSSVA